MPAGLINRTRQGAGRLHCARRLSRHSAAAWSPAGPTSTTASADGFEQEKKGDYPHGGRKLLDERPYEERNRVKASQPRAVTAAVLSRRKIILSVGQSPTFGRCVPRTGVRRFSRFTRLGGEGGALWRGTGAVRAEANG